MKTRLAAGCMTGTSIDALDAALVAIEGEGLAMRPRVLRCETEPLGELAQPLRDFAEQRPMPAGTIAALARDLALLHASTLQRLAAGDTLDLVCVHGQTVFHAPPVSWQLMNPAPIAHALRCPVVFDLRTADLAAGGQGAPITPLADFVLFRDPLAPRAIVNLGGFCNITLLPAAAPGTPAGSLLAGIAGRDVCACNHVLDAIARELLGSPFDVDGREALAGKPDAEALADLAAILLAQGMQGRSLGTGDELGRWINQRRSLGGRALAATACAAIAGTIARAIGPGFGVLLAGGGARNRALTRALEQELGGATTTDELGTPAAYREAACFAVLGALCQDRVPITLPQVTRVSTPAPLAGAWVYP